MDDETRKKILDELLESLKEAEKPNRPEGEGWFTLAEIAEAKGWSIDRTRSMAGKMVKMGRWEKSGRMGLVHYYRLIQRN